MLARLAATLRGGQAGTGGLAAGLAPGEGATVVLDDNCLVCYYYPALEQCFEEKLTVSIGDVILCDSASGSTVPAFIRFSSFLLLLLTLVSRLFVTLREKWVFLDSWM